jgi:hypothetical protein
VFNLFRCSSLPVSHRTRLNLERLGERVNPTMVTGTFQSTGGMFSVTDGTYTYDEDAIDFDDPEQELTLYDLGFTAGPWGYTADEDPVAVMHYGQFVSVEFTASGFDEDGDAGPSLSVEVVGSHGIVMLNNNPGTTFEIEVNLAPVPPVTLAQYQAKIAELNTAIQEQQGLEGSLINIRRQWFTLTNLRSDKDTQLTAELAKPAAQQNAQLIAQLQADIAALDGSINGIEAAYNDYRQSYDAKHAEAVALREVASSMANALTRRGITPNPVTIPTVPGVKTDIEITVLAAM